MRDDVRIYQERLADAVEHFVQVLHREPFVAPKEMVECTWLDGVAFASDGMFWELNQLWWAEVHALLINWDPSAQGGAHMAGITTMGNVDSDGELELQLTLDEREGSIHISREFWLAIGERAGWAAPDGKQTVVEKWARRVIGDAALQNPQERALRVAEEAIELAQALSVPLCTVHDLADYVYDRPRGDPGQEIAGTMVTLYAVAAALGLDAEEAFAKELARIHTPEIEAKVRRRQTEKRERMLAMEYPSEPADQRVPDGYAKAAGKDP